MPASNVDRNEEDGCMKKIRIERSLKLRREDLRGRSYNLVSNTEMPEEDWLSSFGDQRKVYEPNWKPNIDKIHQEKTLISNHYNKDDEANEPKRFKFEYMPKKRTTHASSIRF